MEAGNSECEVEVDTECAYIFELYGTICTAIEKTFQPIDKLTLAKLTANKRNFQPQWYKQIPWLSVCISSRKVYCLYCKYTS